LTGWPALQGLHIWSAFNQRRHKKGGNPIDRIAALADLPDRQA